MTIVTKVGVSYVDHMNDDTPEVDSFTRECYQALSSPSFMRREPGDEATHYPPGKGKWANSSVLHSLSDGKWGRIQTHLITCLYIKNQKGESG